MKDDKSRERSLPGDVPAGQEELLSPDFFDEDEDENGPAEGLQAQIELLAFVVGDEEYAFGVGEIREIIRYQPVTPIPRCPDYILGLISLRGEIVPVIDMKRRLSLGEASVEGEPMIVIVSRGEESVGFLVENISGIIRVPEDALEETPDIVPPDKAEFLRGVVQSGERLVTLLNTGRLLDVEADFSGATPRSA
jgi:purine-binding chemotaxis protein CheW